MKLQNSRRQPKSAQIVRVVVRMAVLALASCVSQAVQAGPDGVDPLHKRLLTLDSHLDTPVHFVRPGWDFGARHERSTDVAQLDIPRMADGNLDGGFFAIFTAQGPLTANGYAAARAYAFNRSAQIDAMLVRHSDKIELARSAADARAIDARGKLIAFKSIENSYPLGDSVLPLAEFQRQGVRLAGPVHTKNNQFADSATDTAYWNGLSPLGQKWVTEMNRLGMVIDASHASDASFDQMLALSKTPLLLSHSGPRAVYDHPRNLDDARLRTLAAAGGALCFSTIYLSQIQMAGERADLFEKIEHSENQTPAEQVAINARWQALNASTPMWKTTFDQYIAALLHTIKVAGIDHVCFGADFDGGGGFPGLEDITALPRVTARLKSEGLSDADLTKLWGGNILRILDVAERHAKIK